MSTSLNAGAGLRRGRKRGEATVMSSSSRDASAEEEDAEESVVETLSPSNSTSNVNSSSMQANKFRPERLKNPALARIRPLDMSSRAHDSAAAVYDGDVEESPALQLDHEGLLDFSKASVTTAESTPVMHSIDGTDSAETAEYSAHDIQTFVRGHLKSDPPKRQIRVYADGVYDLYSFAHALALRQAKLSFPDVHLIVGVASDADCARYKNRPCLTGWERCESVRHCKWVDEVIPDAPWVINQAFLDQHAIDYVAHDDAPYVSAGSEDVYAFVKSQDKFIPTRRTTNFSTSELLARIVVAYKVGQWDGKFSKIGLDSLKSSIRDTESEGEAGG